MFHRLAVALILTRQILPLLPRGFLWLHFKSGLKPGTKVRTNKLCDHYLLATTPLINHKGINM